MFQLHCLSSSSRLRALRLSTSALALALAGALVPPSLAAEVVVTSGTTVGQQVLNPGDTLNVNLGGTVNDANAAVSDAAAGIVSILNNGTIKSTTASGIYTTQSTLDLQNSGNIDGATNAIDAATIGTLINSGTLTSGGATVYSTNIVGSIINSGTITSTGYYGVRGNDVGSLVNSGTISGARFGYYGDGALTSLNNSGTMSGSDYAAAADRVGTVTNSGLMQSNESALFSYGDIASTTNSATGRMVSKYGIRSQASIGSVTNAGEIIGQYGGIDATTSATGTIASVVNTGRIITTDPAAGGVIAAQALLSLTNSGLIAAADPSGFAILEADPALASDTLLTLNAGSILIGHVDIHGGTNTLNVGNGLNLALTFDTSVPEVIQTNGSAYTVVGNTVYVADMDAFAAAGVATAELTGGLGSAADAALDKGFDEKGLDGRGHFWLQAVGGLGHDGATGMNLRYGGLVAGADFGPDAVTRFGAFGGGARSGVGDASTVSSFYAGIYGGAQFDDFSIKGTLTVGATEADTDRLVANNTVATGLETASSTQDAYFLAPSLTITRAWQTQDFSFKTSLGLSYTGVFGHDFAENLATGLTVRGYDTHVFEAKGLLRLPFETVLEGGVLTGDAHAGVEARAVIDSEITGSLAGTTMTLASAGTRATAGAVAGGSLTYELGGGASLFSGIDGAIRTDGSAVISANAGIKAEF